MRAASTISLNVAIWVGLCVVVGWAAARVPQRWLANDTFVTRIRPFERHGRIYDRCGIRRWKGRLPESNSLGRAARPSKRVLTGRSSVPGFIGETRRAEYVHWVILLAGPSFDLWSPTWVARTMTVFGIGFNLPFIAVQRFNRARAVRSGTAVLGDGAVS
mgnify:CR=1 FL=1